MKAAAALLTAVVLVASAALGAASLTAAPSMTGGFAPGAIGTLGLDAEQQTNATIAMQVADRLHTPPLPRLGLMVAALGESDLRDVPNARGSGYCGVWQASPRNLPCDDTAGQAESFLRGGNGFQGGGALALADADPGMTPGAIATTVEASGQPGSFYDAHTAAAAQIIAAWQATTTATAGPVPAGLTAKQVIDRLVLPIAARSGIHLTAEQVTAANAVHGPTVTGGRSDHQGPPDVAWAADMSNGTTTPQEDRLAQALADRFGIPWTGSGLVSATHGGYRFQLIYRTLEGGDHFNHVHFGVRVVVG